MKVDRDKKVSVVRTSTGAAGQNEYGEPDPANDVAVYANVWASIAGINGREYWQAEQVQSKVTTRIELDFLAGIDRSMRVLYGARTFQIVAVIDVGEMHRTLQLLCEEVNP